MTTTHIHEYRPSTKELRIPLSFEASSLTQGFGGLWVGIARRQVPGVNYPNGTLAPIPFVQEAFESQVKAKEAEAKELVRV